MTNGQRGGGAKRFGTGRIVLWRGGSVWLGHAEEKTGSHAHHAIQVTLALSGGAMRIQTPGKDWAAYTAAIICAHQPHAFEARCELVALIFIPHFQAYVRRAGRRDQRPARLGELSRFVQAARLQWSHTGVSFPTERSIAMNTTTQSPCDCAACPGAGCDCGCQTTAEQNPCACGTGCTCGPHCQCGTGCACAPAKAE